MARRSFYSFHYAPDSWRAGQVRNMGVVDGNVPVSDNDWSQVTRGGDAAIERWINDQLKGTSCAIVLIGATTAGRKWVNYEIKQAWDGGKGVLGVHIHNLLDQGKQTSAKGANPFATFNIGGRAMTSIVRTYDPPYSDSTSVYGHIKSNLADWAEEAVRIRAST